MQYRKSKISASFVELIRTCEFPPILKPLAAENNSFVFFATRFGHVFWQLQLLPL